jgi:5,10-methylene-tetrahydrofolate dehydrogenase/methenyl tetrahydrofolate cyclohydrolase
MLCACLCAVRLRLMHGRLGSADSQQLSSSSLKVPWMRSWSRLWCCKRSKHTAAKHACGGPLLQTPGLAVVLVGTRKDSETYVRSKKKGCEEVGIASFGTNLPADVSQADLLSIVTEYNANHAINGILVQLPLPEHIDERAVLDAIDIQKDVDGFHPQSVGCLAMRGREPMFVSCTAKGCITLLERSGVEIAVRPCPVVST